MSAKAIAATASLAEEIQTLERVFPIYAAIGAKFRLGKPPCADFVAAEASPAALAAVSEWVADVESRLHVYQLRQVLQNTRLGTAGEKLGALIAHIRCKPYKSDADRDRLDFLLAQYLAVCAPTGYREHDLSLEEAAEVLDPLLGTGEMPPLPWLEPLEPLISELAGCRGLRELASRQIIERGRALKLSAKQMYFDRACLLAFARFSFIFRRHFFRVMSVDLQEVERCLRCLESRKIEFVDAATLGLTDREPLANLWTMWRNWHRPNFADYSDLSFQRVLQLRETVERAVARGSAVAMPSKEIPLSQLEARLRDALREIADLRLTVEELSARLDAATAAGDPLTGARPVSAT